jgi:hypothetical protein
MIRAVVVRSASRTTNEYSVYRPASMPETIVLMVALSLTDAEILARAGGLVSDDELDAVADFLSIDPKGAA